MHEAALTLFHFILMRTKRCYITEQADTHLVFSKCRRSSTVAMWQYIQQYSTIPLLIPAWPPCALAKGSLPLASAQDSHLQRMRIPEAAYMYN